MDKGLIAALGEEEKLMPYLHLPVQAGSDKILKAMNRGHTAESYIRQIEEIRAARPDIALSGDFIVGFPWRNERGFRRDFGPGRKQSAMRLPIHSSIPAVRERPAQRCQNRWRSRKRMTASPTCRRFLSSNGAEFNGAQIGRTLPVLFEKTGRHTGQLVGRSPYLQSVHAIAPESMLGTIAPVTITDVTPNALAGALKTEGEDAA